MAESDLIDTSTYINKATSVQVSLLDTSQKYTMMAILRMIIACLGIVSNIIVAVALLNHHKLRRKIPNIFIINQVSKILCIVEKIPDFIRSKTYLHSRGSNCCHKFRKVLRKALPF